MRGVIVAVAKTGMAMSYWVVGGEYQNTSF
jgi:hypothetical protein